MKVHRANIQCRSSVHEMYHVDNKKETTMKECPIQYANSRMAQREGVHLYENVKNVGVAHKDLNRGLKHFVAAFTRRYKRYSGQ